MKFHPTFTSDEFILTELCKELAKLKPCVQHTAICWLTSADKSFRFNSFIIRNCKNVQPSNFFWGDRHIPERVREPPPRC